MFCFCEKLSAWQDLQCDFLYILSKTWLFHTNFFQDFDSEVKWRVLKVELNPIPIKSDEKIEDETEEELAKKLFKIEAVFPSNKSFKDPATITIERFAIITVSLTRKVKSNKLDAKLVRPIPTLSFERNNSVVIESSTEGDLDSD